MLYRYGGQGYAEERPERHTGFAGGSVLAGALPFHCLPEIKALNLGGSGTEPPSSFQYVMLSSGFEWVNTGTSVSVILVWSKLREVPLRAICIVIICPVINSCLYFGESGTLADVYFILHVAVEALLRSVIPAIRSP